MKTKLKKMVPCALCLVPRVKKMLAVALCAVGFAAVPSAAEAQMVTASEAYFFPAKADIAPKDANRSHYRLFIVESADDGDAVGGQELSLCGAVGGLQLMALAEQNVEFCGFERRRDLVLYDLTFYSVAVGVCACFQRFLLAYINTDGGIEFKCTSAGRRFGTAEHNANLLS